MKRKLNKTKKLAGVLVGSMLTMNAYNFASAQENTIMSATMEEQTELAMTQEMATYSEQPIEQVAEEPATSEPQTEQPTEAPATSEPQTEQPTEAPTTSEPQTEQPTEAPTTSEPQTEQPIVVPPTETPTQEPEQVTAGELVISREKMQNAITENSDFEVEVLLKNTWNQGSLKNVKLSTELPSGVTMDASYVKETIDVSDIAAGSEQKVKIRLHADKLEENQPILKMVVNVSFEHEGDPRTETRENLLLPATVKDSDDSNGDDKQFVDNMSGYSGGGSDASGGSAGSGEEKKKVDPMVPRIIVTQCDYDKKASAGQEFTANITIFNTSDKLSVENMIMTFDTGGTATIENSSNTVYLQKLAAQGSYTAQLKLKVPEDSKSKSADLTISFKYEYMKNTDRAEVESSSKISLPVESVDKFTAGNIQTSDDVQLGEEFTASLTYVNKGTSAIRNLEAYIESDMKVSETYKYIGNVEAGTSGTVDFFVTPESEGNQKVKITLKYQDAAGNEKTIEKEGSFQVEEAIDEMQLDESSMSEENYNMSQQIPSETTEKKPVMAATGLGGAAVIGIAAVLSFWKKRKHSEENEEL